MATFTELHSREWQVTGGTGITQARNLLVCRAKNTASNTLSFPSAAFLAGANLGGLKIEEVLIRSDTCSFYRGIATEAKVIFQLDRLPDWRLALVFVSVNGKIVGLVNKVIFPKPVSSSRVSRYHNVS